MKIITSYTTEELKKAITENPITIDRLQDFIDENEIVVIFQDLRADVGCWYQEGPNKYVMKIDSKQPEHEQEKIMIHEFAHGLFPYGGEKLWVGYEEYIHEPIRREAIRFHDKNPDVVSKLLKHYKTLQSRK